MAMSLATQRVSDALGAAGLSCEIIEFAVSTRTAADAAQAVGTTVGQIVKSLVFMADASAGRALTALLVLTSGSNVVDLQRLAALCQQPVRRASADEVREWTGFAIGGVSPLGHSRAIPTYMDRDLLRYERVFAAAGTPNSVFSIAPGDLQRITRSVIADVRAL